MHIYFTYESVSIYAYVWMSSTTVQPSRKQHCVLSAWPQWTHFQRPHCRDASSRHLWVSLDQPPRTWLPVQTLAVADLYFEPLFGLDREVGRSYSLPQAPQWCIPQINDIFEASHKQRGCVSSCRGRQHRVEVTKSCVENSWESRTKPRSFHPTNFATFGKSCLFPLFFQLSQQNGWA